MQLTTATDAEVEDAMELLDDAGLPTDVDREGVILFVGRVDGRPVGICGLEVRGPHALVRSVVVEPGRRGDGRGTALIEELCDRARERGVRELYLLTENAAGFFEKGGFERAEREAAPEAIRETREFAAVCPASAACLSRALRNVE
ncbi:GNAT family N-acetyltransferase [Halobacteriales archaeon QS_8_65_32]|jgi:amino-acid N-acetyltransferase|nr:MAG: GNAT family N-acetyltransferase [Halobacteriales archaeon QS_8_65_32]